MRDVRLLGALLSICGTILFGLIHVGIAIYATQFRGDLSDGLGAISGWVPYILSIVLMILGACTLYYYFLKKQEERMQSRK